MKISNSGMGLPLDSSDSSRKLIHAVRHDRAQREEILRGIVIYEVAGVACAFLTMPPTSSCRIQ